ncbi:hypothetical protein BD626DRAFT_505908 [Schizophyllum amplum]|uniref:Zinc-finger domain-containing protein n=1 Tax=Schizophyllum amplum TaxID=97359 RepID=A0A550C616_9AGAR|nr:hypothetical protein BD626DRAFT_505908 [Auriculariopsis ampla]
MGDQCPFAATPPSALTPSRLHMPSWTLLEDTADHISISSQDASGSDDSDADGAAETDTGDYQEVSFAPSVHNSPAKMHKARYARDMSSPEMSASSTLVNDESKNAPEKSAHSPSRPSSEEVVERMVERTDAVVIHLPRSHSSPAHPTPPVHELFTPPHSRPSSPLSGLSTPLRSATAPPHHDPSSPLSSSPYKPIIIRRATRPTLPSKRKLVAGSVEGRPRKRARICLDYVAVTPFPAGLSREDYVSFADATAMRRPPSVTPSYIEISSSSSSSPSAYSPSRRTTPGTVRDTPTPTADNRSHSVIDLVTDDEAAPLKSRRRGAASASQTRSRRPSNHKTYDSVADAINNLNNDSSDDEEVGVQKKRRAHSAVSRKTKRIRDNDWEPSEESREKEDVGSTSRRAASKRSRKDNTRVSADQPSRPRLPTRTPSVVRADSVEVLEVRPPAFTQRQLSKRPAYGERPPSMLDAIATDTTVLPCATNVPSWRKSVLMNTRFLPVSILHQRRHAEALRNLLDEKPDMVNVLPTRFFRESKVIGELVEDNGNRESKPFDRDATALDEGVVSIEEETSTIPYAAHGGTPPTQSRAESSKPTDVPPVGIDAYMPLAAPQDDLQTPPPVLYTQMPTCVTPAQLLDSNFRLTVTPPSEPSSKPFEQAAQPSRRTASPNPSPGSAEFEPVDPRDIFMTDFLSVTDDHISLSGPHGRSTRAPSPADYLPGSSFRGLNIPFGDTDEPPSFALSDDEMHATVDSWMHAADIGAEFSVHDLQHGFPPSLLAPSGSASQSGVVDTAAEVTVAPFAPFCAPRSQSSAYSYVSGRSSRPSSAPSSRPGSPREKSVSVPLAGPSCPSQVVKTVDASTRPRHAAMYPPPHMAGPDAPVNFMTFQYPRRRGGAEGSSCHQCRIKTSKQKQAMVCACGKSYCSRCIILRYHNVIEFDPSAKFTCPSCENYCSCDNCCNDRGDEFIPLRKFMLRRPPDANAARPSSPKGAPEVDATIDMNHMDSPSPSPRPLRPTRRPYVVNSRDGPVRFWGTIFDLKGGLVGNAYAPSPENPDVVVVSRPDESRAAHAGGAARRRTFIGAVQKSWGKIDKRKITFVDGGGRAGKRDKGISAGARQYIGNRANLFRPLVPPDEDEEDNDESPITSIQWTRDRSLSPPAWDSEDIGIRDDHVVTANALQNLLNFELSGGHLEPYPTTPA